MTGEVARRAVSSFLVVQEASLGLGASSSSPVTGVQTGGRAAREDQQPGCRRAKDGGEKPTGKPDGHCWAG